jgi:hypothetical protein
MDLLWRVRILSKFGKQVAKLLSKADIADSGWTEDGWTLPEEISRRQDRLEQQSSKTCITRNLLPAHSIASGLISQNCSAITLRTSVR